MWARFVLLHHGHAVYWHCGTSASQLAAQHVTWQCLSELNDCDMVYLWLLYSLKIGQTFVLARV